MASKAATHYLQFDIQWASIGKASLLFEALNYQALIWYDYALTFPMEVQYFWTSKVRLSTFLYILCRYALLANVLYLLDIAGKLTDNCNTWYQFIGALSVLGRAAIIDLVSIVTEKLFTALPKVVFTGRTWAVWGRNRFILAYMSFLGVICVALDIAFRAHGKSMKEQKEGFQYLLFEQGIFYFSIVSLFTTAAVILNFQAPSGFFQRLLNALTLPLSGLLTARFLLHIRQWEYTHSPAAASVHDRNPDGQDQSHTMSFRAASAVLSTFITSDFGSDPVQTRDPNSRKIRNRDDDPSTPSVPSSPSYIVSGAGADIESQSTPEIEKPENSAEKTEAVREGKKRVRVMD
ncbi:hypothetical protein F5880DRAFT_1504018 [Lentinula raphanica]|nr:hypothetical protein F5880DRAFT_1504018 [Lentinula raphanica]